MEFDLCQESANFLLSKTNYRPKIGIICGTGLGRWLIMKASARDVDKKYQFIHPKMINDFEVPAVFASYIPAAGIGELLETPDVIPYEDIPNFPVSTVSLHKSRCLFGLLGHTEVFLMQGRFHLYEGYDIGQVCIVFRCTEM